MELDERIFVAVLATGIGYADRSREENGDWKRLAILFFSDLRAEIADDCPPDLREQIIAHMEPIQAMEGEQYRKRPADHELCGRRCPVKDGS